MDERQGTGELIVIRLAEVEGIAEFASRIEGFVRAGIVRFVIDLGSVAVVNSTLLGVFVKTRIAATAKGGNVVLVNPSEFVAKALGLLGLDELFTIAPDVPTAVAGLWPGD
ncbi:MAG: STAS domain-containing protein [Planctomycetota bacterium]|jgi:anti-anti-sigma factor